MKIRLLFLFFLISLSSIAQKATISGVITDKEYNNEPLPFANIVVKNTKVSTVTNENGEYSININPGNYIIQFSFIGYDNLEVPVTVASGENLTVSKALGSGGFTLQDVVIQNNSNREKETALLLDQKKAVEMKQAIGTQEMSRKGVSDVASAVIKTTGITKQEGSGNVFVRGLGDRYNSTTMNGLPVPSNNPENKNMNLDIFSTDIVEYISIDKVYNNRFFGDFAGGNVDIVSKDYSGKSYLKLDAGSKVNTNAISNNDFQLQKGFNSFGFENRTIPSNSLNSYKFKTLELGKSVPFSGSIGLSGGNSFSVGKQGKLNLFAMAAFDNEFSSIKNGVLKGSVNGAGVAGQDYYSYSNNNYSTNTTAMLNLGYKINLNHKINFNTLFINNSSQTLEEGKGYIVDLANDGNGFKRFSNFSQNRILINQLLGNHKISERLVFDWKVAYNNVQADVPDRDQNIMNIDANGGYTLNSQSAPNNNRYFQFLTETELASVASLAYKFGEKEGDYNGKFTVGYSGRNKTSDFKATQFNLKSENGYLSTLVDPNNLDLFYNQENFANGFFKISTFRGNNQVAIALLPQSYKGEQQINGGFANLEYQFNKLSAVIGTRYEMINQKINYNTQLGGEGKISFDKPAVLPSLILKYELTEKQNLRLGFSKTYTLPQFKEKAPFVYEKFGQAYIGNKNVYASDDYNLDLKWEMFPEKEELISFTAFGKYIQNPINEIVINSSTNDISYINTGNKGVVFGGEMEYRKNILDLDNKKLSFGLNASYLHTDQDLDNKKIEKETSFSVAFNNTKDKFTGASDLLLNADISLFNQWNDKESNLNSTLSYSYFSDRISAIGTNDRGNMVDKAFGSLDLILKSKLTKNIGLGFVAKNLLDPTIKRVQENPSSDVTILSYKKGINLSLSMSYQF